MSASIWSPSASLNVFENIRAYPPVGLTAATWAVNEGDFSFINLFGGIVTVTLPSGAASRGRILYFKAFTAFAMISASANVNPITAVGVPGTALCPTY
jgi:hypothetical protein